MRSLKSELASLSSIIDQAGTEREQQVREYEVALHERDILSTQLVRRNDELALLYEKVKLQQQTLSRGECAYRESREDARLLKLKRAVAGKPCRQKSRPISRRAWHVG